MNKWKELNDFKNKYNINLKKAKNLIANKDGVILGTNADSTNNSLADMCILFGPNIPIKYLECIVIENKKIFIISSEEEKFLDNELKEC